MARPVVLVRMLALTILAALTACSMPGEAGFGSQNARTNVPARPSVSQTSTASAKPAISLFMVKQVQARLQQQGFYSGNVDGVWGPATEGAVENYQKAQGMTPTGQLDTQTITALNLDGPRSRSNIAYPPRDPVKSSP